MYSVNFPDLEGCRTYGDNLPDACDMAQDVPALTLWLKKI
jgi:predicted RNase H-like HicB family nuclease